MQCNDYLPLAKLERVIEHEVVSSCVTERAPSEPRALRVWEVLHDFGGKRRARLEE